MRHCGLRLDLFSPLTGRATYARMCANTLWSKHSIQHTQTHLRFLFFFPPLANTVTLNFRKHKMPLSVFVGKQFPINLRRRMPHRQYVQMHPKGATNQVGGAGRQAEAGGRWKGAKALPCSKSFARALIAFLANMKMYSRHASSHFANVPANESRKSEREREGAGEDTSVWGKQE